MTLTLPCSFTGLHLCLSPSQLLTRANLPLVAEQLKPELSYLEDFYEQDGSFKRKQVEDYDRRHGVHPLPPIPDDSEVWITSDKNRVRVTGQRETLRSYTINTPNGQVCRNRHQLNVMPSPQSSIVQIHRLQLHRNLCYSNGIDCLATENGKPIVRHGRARHL